MSSVASDSSRYHDDEELGKSYTDKSVSSSSGTSRDTTPELAQRETKAVFRLRFLVILALLLAAVIVCVSVYFVTTNGEKRNSETEFEQSALKIMRSFDEIVQHRIQAIAALSDSITAYARASNSTWPFVTVPDWAERCESAYLLSGMKFLVFYPIITKEEDAREWGKYSLDNSGWLERGRTLQREAGFELTDYLPDDYMLPFYTTEGATPPLYFEDGMGSEIFTFNENFTSTIVDPGPGPYVPLHQAYPSIPIMAVNINIVRFPQYGQAVQGALDASEVVIGGLVVAPPGPYYGSPDTTTTFHASMISYDKKKPSDYEGDPVSIITLPIFDSFEKEEREMVGALVATVQWASYFRDIVETGTGAITVVLVNSCDPDESNTVTYTVTGPDVSFVGMGDFHETAYSEFGKVAQFNDIIDSGDENSRIKINHDYCRYEIRVYPTQDFESSTTTNKPLVLTIALCGIFVFTAAMFVLYDRLVERRQALVMNSAQRSNAIVSSLFPKSIQDRLLREGSKNPNKAHAFASDKKRIASFLTGSNGTDEEEEDDLNPIADLFPHATVMFADIAGFTSWSSSREPGHVFILLQTVYQAFDTLAQKHKVFKIETIGDSYVACTGIPNPQKNHVVLMSRFAWDCLKVFSSLTKKLEAKLGPDTSELGIRIGIHSGPVTAGVLRGERARFQLFGDTVNTAARMESTCHVNKIQASQAAAKLLEEAGKGHWCTKRKESVEAKGKGVLEAFWVAPRNGTSATSGSETTSNPSAVISSPFNGAYKANEERLINWLTQLLLGHLQHIVARRQALGNESTTDPSKLVYHVPTGKTCLDEMQKCLYLPEFEAKTAHVGEIDAKDVLIDDIVVKQLHDYIATIASTYRDNPFHNFAHASHVTMCVDKFLKRIVRPDIEIDGIDVAAAHVHDYTHGINSDPITLLAIVMSAMIHDSDHRGVSNMQLIKEEPYLAKLYNNKSVAEAHSLDLSWELLMSPDFGALRSCMFGSTKDMFRFRQVLVNVVLATDIFDQELNSLRKDRWNEAFQEESIKSSNFKDLRATIVIEHLMQASDVSHTMQHWHVYRKWNERLFTEMYLAFQAGRMGKDPSEFWYQGEVGFFDNYIIPLAKKLKECNVFGVSSDECLNYALHNRMEWEQRGKDIVAEMVAKLSAQTKPALPEEPSLREEDP